MGGGVKNSDMLIDVYVAGATAKVGPAWRCASRVIGSVKVQAAQVYNISVGRIGSYIEGVVTL
jgi:hypothetical protein